MKRTFALGLGLLAALLGAAQAAGKACPPAGMGPPCTVTTTADETRLAIPLPEADAVFRCTFFHNPHRLVIDILKPTPETERRDPMGVSPGSRPWPKTSEGTTALFSSIHPTDPRMEKFSVEHLSGRSRYTIYLRQAPPTAYRLGRDGRTLVLMLRSPQSPSGTPPTQESNPLPPWGKEHGQGAPPLPPWGRGQGEGAPTQEPDPSSPVHPPLPPWGKEHGQGAPPLPLWGRGHGEGAPTQEPDPSSPAHPPLPPLGKEHGEGAPPLPPWGRGQGEGAPIQFKGFLEATGAADTRRENRYEHTRAFRNRIRLETKLPLPSSPGAASHVLLSGESDILWFGPEKDRTDVNPNLYEAYLHWADGPLELRLGKQIVRWGKTDQLSPVDALNAQDLRQFIVPTLEERKIPNWMARLRFFRDPFSVEAVAVPFFEPADMDFWGTDWALYRHTRDVLESAPLPPPLRESLSRVGVTREEPSRTAANAQWGVRTSGTVSGWDMAASYLYGWNPMPYVTSFPAKGLVSDGSFHPSQILQTASSWTFVPGDVAVSYKRTHVAGLEWETVLGPFGFRGETAYFSDTVLLTSDLTSTSTPSLFTVIGLDRQGDNDWYANLQLGHQVLFDDDEEILYFKRHNLSLNGELRKGFFRGDLEARLRAMLMLTDGGSYWNPSLSFLRFRPLSLTFGFNLFAGPADTFLGTYGDNDQAYVTVRYDF